MSLLTKTTVIITNDWDNMTSLHQKIAEARTLLFVPGNRPERFQKALDSKPDMIVLDLEDAVGVGDKDVARHNITAWLDAGGPGLIRINDVETPWFESDMRMLEGRECGLMVPKVTCPEQITEVLARMSAAACALPLLEVAAGILEARRICAAPGVVRAVFGNADLGRELGVDHADRSAMYHARCEVVLASVAAGIASPIDGVTTAVHDHDLVFADAEHAARIGFTRKLCLHPRQVKLVEEAFAPSEEDVRWARAVLGVSSDGSGTALRGEVVGKPIVDRARRLLRYARDVETGA